MYFYIFDPGKEKEAKYFERIQGRLLNLIAEAHIDGESYRVSSIRTVELLVEQALSLGAKTLVVVGSDATLNRSVNAIVRRRAEIILGFIPLDQDSGLAKIFGISSNVEEAVRTIAGRLVYEFDLGACGEHYFLSRVDLGNAIVPTEEGMFGFAAARQFLKLRPFSIKMSLEDSFVATAEVMGAQIINCRDNTGCRLKLGNPTDQLLDILFLNKMSSSQILRYRRELASGCLDNVPGATVMHAKKIDILGPKKLPLTIEGQVYTKAPATITVATEKVKIIVGKTRQFYG